ncbi:flagellar basal-body rod protein flgF domain protein [Shigella boydii 5216-82]|nr:flagellar basal-body rod protein flgF domain protein [Shigella boydii 5216-82]
MDHAIYTAMGAASQTLNQQAVTASNLANASMPGFRAQCRLKGFHCPRARW